MKMLNTQEQAQLAELLTEALRSARMEQFSAGFSIDRILVQRVHGGNFGGTDIREGDVMHPSNFIRGMLEMHHGSWVLSPLERAMEMLGIPIPTKGDPSTFPDANIPTVRAEAPVLQDDRPTAATAAAVSITTEEGAGAMTGRLAKPHKHAAIIKAWADDTSQRIWYWEPSDHVPEWVEFKFGANAPAWREDAHYALGDKPTAPPRRTCTLAGVEFPAPETKAPSMHSLYWIAMPVGTIANSAHWDAMPSERVYLDAGLVHLNEAAAIQHGNALRAATKQAIEAAR